MKFLLVTESRYIFITTFTLIITIVFVSAVTVLNNTSSSEHQGHY
jgi:hypothetical protein